MPPVSCGFGQCGELCLQPWRIFDTILDSASIGTLKGDLVDGQSPFFGPWLSDQRIAPSEAVLVDDSPAASAAAIGMQTRLVEDPRKLASVLAEFGRS